MFVLFESLGREEGGGGGALDEVVCMFIVS
jgi:hypothetical protein